MMTMTIIGRLGNSVRGRAARATSDAVDARNKRNGAQRKEEEEKKRLMRQENDNS